MKKKVAICLSGHVRSFSKGFEEINRSLIENNKNTFDFDFFISTWNMQDWRMKENKKTSLVLKDLENTFNPLQLEIEENIKWDTSKYLNHVHNERWLKKGPSGSRTKGEHILGMFYKIKKANDLKKRHEEKHNYKYDLVVRARTDIGYHQNIDLEEMFDRCNSTIFVSKASVSAKQKDGIKFSDVFAFSSSENMDVYSDLYDELYEIVKKYDIFRPEPILNNYLVEEKSINVSELTTDWFLIS